MSVNTYRLLPLRDFRKRKEYHLYIIEMLLQANRCNSKFLVYNV